MDLEKIADGLCLIADGLREEKKQRKKTSAAHALDKAELAINKP